MPRYSSISFQPPDTSIRAVDANYRLQSTFTDTNTPVLLLSTENPGIPLTLLLQNSLATLDNCITFKSQNDIVGAQMQIGLSNNQYLISSTSRPILLTNQTANQVILLDNNGNINVQAPNGSVTLSSSNTLIQLTNTAFSLTSAQAQLDITQTLSFIAGQSINFQSQNITVQSNVSFQGDTFEITKAHLTVSNGLDILVGDLLVADPTSSTTLSGSLQVDKVTVLNDTTVQTTLTTNGIASFLNNVSILGSVTIEGQNGLTLSQGPLLSSSTSLSMFMGPIQFNDQINVLNAKPLYLSGLLDVSSNTILRQQVDILGAGGLNVSNGSINVATGNMNVSKGSLAVQNGIICSGGGLQLTGDLKQIGGSINSDGDVTLKNGSIYLNNGRVLISTGADVVGLDIMNANMHIGGQTEMDDLVVMNNGLTVTSGLTTTQNVMVQNALMVSNDTDLGGALRVKDVATFISDIIGTGSMTLSKTLRVGSITDTTLTATQLCSGVDIYQQSRCIDLNGNIIVQLTTDGSQSSFNNGMKIRNQTLDIYAGFQLIGGSFTTANNSSATFGGPVTVNALLNVNSGITITKGAVSVGADGLSVLGPLSTSSQSTFNGPVTFMMPVAIQNDITSSGNITSTKVVNASQFQNSGGTFMADAQGNLTAMNVTATNGAFTSITSLGYVQANSFQNANNNFIVTSAGDLKVATATINQNVRLTASSSAGTIYTLNLPTNLPSTNGQALVSDTNGNLSWTNNIATPYPAAFTFTAANNQSQATAVNNLLFTQAGREIYIEVILTMSSTKYKALYILNGWKDGSGDGEWHLNYKWSASRNLGLSFTIDSNTSQIYYTSPNYPSFTGLSFIVSYQ